MCVSVYLSVCLFVCLSVCLCVCMLLFEASCSHNDGFSPLFSAGAAGPNEEVQSALVRIIVNTMQKVSACLHIQLAVIDSLRHKTHRTCSGVRASSTHFLPHSLPPPPPPPPKKKINRMRFYARNFMGFVASISWPISS